MQINFHIFNYHFCNVNLCLKNVSCGFSKMRNEVYNGSDRQFCYIQISDVHSTDIVHRTFVLCWIVTNLNWNVVCYSIYYLNHNYPNNLDQIRPIHLTMINTKRFPTYHVNKKHNKSIWSAEMLFLIS